MWSDCHGNELNHQMVFTGNCRRPPSPSDAPKVCAKSAMLINPDATPCPTEAAQSSQVSFCDDVSEDLSYTTEFKALLRNVGPRRRTSVAPRSHVATIASNLSAAPSTSSKPMDGQEESSHAPKRWRHAIAPPRRRVSQLLTQRVEESAIVETCAPNMHKKPRRRTIYIPREDTTVLTIHPGTQSDRMALKGNPSRSEQQAVANLPTRDGNKGEKHCARRISLAAAPKKIPLQPTLRPLQEVDDRCDSYIAGHGKENIPPGSSEASKRRLQQGHMFTPKREPVPQANSQYSPELVKLYNHQWHCAKDDGQHTTKAVDRWEPDVRLPQITRCKEPASNGIRRASMVKKRNSLYYGKERKAASNAEGRREQVVPPVKVVPTAARQDNMKAKVQYPILEENIDKPEMYEDAWLNHQEAAIQQLLNMLFEKGHEKIPAQQWDQQHFRRELLCLYQDSECILIYKRLHASLLYGALNPPQGSIADIGRFKSDVGIRQRFLAMWLSNYDMEALMCAAEVVVGRNVPYCSSFPTSSLPRSHEDSLKERRRSVGLFIESCLLRNEDAHDQSDRSNALWCWRRTMLRCLMMVLLLDKSKEGGLLPKNLFHSFSIVKSSGDILTRLLSQIAPFLGDGTRPLAYLQYHVHHIQSPLSEFKYCVHNIATDFRDGVQLTRLVELLLYASHALKGSREVPDEMPGGGILRSSSDHHTLWPLSRHLLIPCLTPSQKVHNVQIALNALDGFGGAVENIAESIRAEDIVDGHREKTVALLWAFVGTYGLNSLFNVRDVQREIRRLSKLGFESTGRLSKTQDDLAVAPNEPVGSTHCLKQWATASARCQGVELSNFTTSFSDGSVFAAIVDEYRQYLPKEHLSRRPGAAELEAKLKDIGCSNTFGKAPIV